MYLYLGHLDGLYCSDCEYDWEDLYCEECGDSDTYLGEAESAKEALELLADEISVFGQGELTLEHVLERLRFKFEDCPTYEEAEKIIGEKLITDIQETNTTFINNNKDNIELIVLNYKWKDNDYLIKLASEKEKVFTEVTLEVLLTAKELNMTLEEAKEEVEGYFVYE